MFVVHCSLLSPTKKACILNCFRPPLTHDGVTFCVGLAKQDSVNVAARIGGATTTSKYMTIGSDTKALE